ncbi:MAG: efflux RND transporter permease subunit [Deltaproteobacteria bacterium]|nr:efflux RND transporter permease subunit [Deltaproteobacteria bacterium]
MSLSEFSIKNSVFAWMLMLGLIFFGAISFRSLGISEMPDVDFPVVNVQVTYEGAAPEVMEMDVVDLIEDAVMSVEGIKTLSSTSQQGSANITIEFNLDRNIDFSLQEVQTKIAQVQKNLPHEIDPPIVTKTNPEDQPILWLGLSAEKADLRELIEYARDHLKDKLQTVNGVGEILLSGYVDLNLRIWIDPDQLKKQELTVEDVLEAIRREHIEIPAGRIETSSTEINLRAMGEAKTPEELGHIQIRKRGGAPIYKPIELREVARIVPGLADVRRISRTQGNLALGLGIKKQRGSNAVAIAQAVKLKMAEIEKTLPPGYKLGITFDTTRFIEQSTDQMKHHLALAALLTAVVCLFFLGSWASTFNILLAIPTSIVGCFTLILFFGFTLNTFTLLALILSIGIVVDDAIMVLENIIRHKEMGKTALQAAREGAKEISSAAIATTLAIIAIFIPVIFMKGIIGKFFFQFGIVLSATVILSLIEALTITPMRTSRMLRGDIHESRFERMINFYFSRVASVYKSAIALCLRFRWLVLILSLVLFVSSFWFLTQVKKEFVPAQDQSSFLVRFQTPLGSSIQFTDEKIKEAEKIIAAEPSLNRYFSAVGGFTGGDVNTAIAFVTLKELPDRPLSPATHKHITQIEVMNDLREKLLKIPDLRVVMQDLSTRGFTAQRGFPVEFSVRGPEWDELAKISEQLREKMKSDPYFKDVDSDYQLGQPEIQIFPLRDAAALRGVSMQDLGTTINALMGGVREGKFTEKGRRNDIRLRLEESSRLKGDQIKNLLVRNQQGELVSLGDIVRIEEHKTLKSITRKDRERAISLFSNVGQGKSQEEALKEVEKIAKEILPPNYRIVLSGSAETFKESFNSLFFALWMGVVVAYMILASQYNSFIHPFLVLLALPFSLSGAWIALYFSGQSLNLYSFIGLILLMGIAKKNSIMLVDFTNHKRAEGRSTREALLEACPQRLRPILMTSFATVAAAIPSALSRGAGYETRMPMAVILIGGIFLSTWMTLFVIPCAYEIFSKMELKKEKF